MAFKCFVELVVSPMATMKQSSSVHFLMTSWNMSYDNRFFRIPQNLYEYEHVTVTDCGLA